MVNATGVWADACPGAGRGHPPARHPPGQGRARHRPGRPHALRHRGGDPGAKDRRSIFVVSWPETDLVYLGTTDTDYDGPLDDPACTPEDVDYLLGRGQQRDDVRS